MKLAIIGLATATVLATVAHASADTPVYRFRQMIYTDGGGENGGGWVPGGPGPGGGGENGGGGNGGGEETPGGETPEPEDNTDYTPTWTTTEPWNSAWEDRTGEMTFQVNLPPSTPFRMGATTPLCFGVTGGNETKKFHISVNTSGWAKEFALDGGAWLTSDPSPDDGSYTWVVEGSQSSHCVSFKTGARQMSDPMFNPYLVSVTVWVTSPSPAEGVRQWDAGAHLISGTIDPWLPGPWRN